MRLWVDDIRPAPDKWEHAKTLQHAKAFILNYRDNKLEITHMSLDHDLGLWSSGDGTELVNFLAEFELWPTEGIAVHSMNPVGRTRMLQTIDRYSGFAPSAGFQRGKW